MITALIALGPLHRLDKLAQDQLFQRPGVTDTNILIIGIDEDALDVLGPYNTWDRSVMAAALQSCEEGAPKDILLGVDQAVRQFVGTAPQFDDLTMLCLQYNSTAQ